jgi:hypothetical protein
MTADAAPAAAGALLATAARLDLTAGQLTLTVIVLSAPGRAPNAA